MGTITVRYKMQRDDRHEPNKITDPTDWFDAITDERYFEQIKPKYDALPDDQKANLRTIFDDEDVMASQSSAKMWYNENFGDDEIFATKKEQVLAFMSANAPATE